MDQKCKHCGAALEGYESFCPDCGRDLTETEAAPCTEPLPEDPADWFTVHEDDEVPQLRKTAVRRPAQADAQPSRPLSPQPERAAYPDRSERREPPRAAQQRRPAPKKPGAPAQTPKKRAAQPVTIPARTLKIAALALLLIAGVLTFTMCRGSDRAEYPFTAVVDRYFAAVRTANANNYIATRPAEYTAYLTTGAGSAYQNESDYRAQTSSALHERLAEYQEQYGDIRSITYELTSVIHYNHRCEALSDVLTGWYNFPENSVTDAYIVNGSYTVGGTAGSGDYNIDELLLINIGGQWYFSPDAGNYWRAE